jgi:hypothetical protein
MSFHGRTAEQWAEEAHNYWSIAMRFRNIVMIVAEDTCHAIKANGAINSILCNPDKLCLPCQSRIALRKHVISSQ